MFKEKKRENGEKKGKVMKKGEEKRGRGGADGEYGESVRGIPAFDIAG